MNFKPSPNYNGLLAQAYSMKTLIESLQSQLAILDKQVSELRAIDRSISLEQINALREENQMLTNLLEAAERK